MPVLSRLRGVWEVRGVAKKRIRPKVRRSPPATGRLLRLSGVLLVVALLWLFFAPGVGVLAWWGKRAELRQLERESAMLAEENARLEESINRLQNDPLYLEEVARKEHLLLRRDEQVFDFSSGDSK